MGLFSSKPRISDPYNTMGDAASGGEVTGCGFCSTRGYITGTTGGKSSPGDLRLPIGPGDRQVRPGVWEIKCPECKGRGY